MTILLYPIIHQGTRNDVCPFLKKINGEFMSYSFHTVNYGSKLVHYNFLLIRYAFRATMVAVLLFSLFILCLQRYQGLRLFYLRPIAVLMFLFLVGSQGPEDAKLTNWLYDEADLCQSYGKAEARTRLINWSIFSLLLFCCIYNV
jgi:hypothetical protein